MFEQSVLELATTRRANRKLATAISFVLQGVVVGTLILVPLLYTQALPTRELVTFLIAPAPPPPPPPPPAAVPKVHVIRRVSTDLTTTGQLKMPTRIPKKIEMLKENAAPPTFTAAGVVGGVPGGVPGGQLGGVIGGILSSVPKATYVPKVAVPKMVRVSQGVTAGLLVHRVQPSYPPIARDARIQGTVLLQAIIGKDGKIDDLQVVRGHPMLVAAALSAVKQWRYKPYLLNGTPVEVETQITVNFHLG